MKFGVLSLALLTATAFFNVLVDGVGVFHFNKGLKFAAANLIQGKMVAGPMGVYEEREFQRLIIEQYEGQRDMIAIGSSRTLSVRARFINGQINFFNHSVSGVFIEDFVAIIGIYKEKRILPKTVMLGMDPWVFNKDNGLPAGWKILDRYYQEMIPEFAKLGSNTKLSMKNLATGNPLARYRQLINLEYTLQNWKYLREGKSLYITDTTNIDDFIREPDGSMHFPYKMRFAKRDEEIDDPMNAPPEQYFNKFHALYGTDLFEGLVKYLIANGTEVIFLLPPLHPTAYRFANDHPKYQIIVKVESYLFDLARQNNILLIGSFDPNRYGFSGADFFDSHHGNDNVLLKLFEEYRKKR